MSLEEDEDGMGGDADNMYFLPDGIADDAPAQGR